MVEALATHADPTDERETPAAAVAEPPARSEKLSLKTKIAFNAHGFFVAGMGLLVSVFLGKFYIDVVLLPAGLYAIAVTLGRSFDAIIDPVMGWITDHTRTRWGRRKPWILLGVLGNAVVFYLMLTPPTDLSPGGAMQWFLGCYVTSFLFITIVAVPRTALGAELTLDARERVSLYAYMALFLGLGLAFAGATYAGLRSVTQDERALMRIQATIYITGYVLVNMWFLRVIRERPEFLGRGETAFVPGVRRALRSRPFVVMFTSHVVTAVPVAIPATLVPFFVQYVLKLEDSGKWTLVFAAAFIVPGFVALPMWLWLAKRKGKLFVWLVNGAIGVTGGVALFSVGPGDTALALGILCYVGLQSGVWTVLGNAMHADVIDYDELQTGKRREAQFGALWSIIPKFATIPGAAIPLAILGGIGYVPNQATQPPEVVLALRVLFALAPAAFNAIGVAIMWWYPLSEDVHAKIRAGVARHERGEDADDPITGKRLPPPRRRGVEEADAWYLDTFSTRELRAYVERGTSPLASIWAWLAACTLLAGGASAFAVARIPGFERDPGPVPSLALVVAGLALTGALFHAMRIAPARRLNTDREIARRHLDSLA
jgi:GPH family glycoside/pentoside/hexuronide:cation symporter